MPTSKEYRTALEKWKNILSGMTRVWELRGSNGNGEDTIIEIYEEMKSLLSQPEPSGEDFAEILRTVLPTCISCGKITATYVCDEGPVCGKECMSELDGDADEDCFEYEVDENVKKAIVFLEGQRQATMTDEKIVRAFVERVNKRAEDEMLKTHRIEGAHHRAIIAELAEFAQAGERGGE